MNKSDDRTEEPKRVPPTHAAGDAVGRVFNVAVAGFAFGFLGHWIGTKFGAADVFAVIGALLGATAGFYSLYAHVTARSKQDGNSKSP